MKLGNFWEGILGFFTYRIFCVFAVVFSQKAPKCMKLSNFKLFWNFWKVWKQTFHLIYDVMGFKLILDPLEVKIHPSEISQKMKKFIFMSTFQLVKSAMPPFDYFLQNRRGIDWVLCIPQFNGKCKKKRKDKHGLKKNKYKDKLLTEKNLKKR